MQYINNSKSSYLSLSEDYVSVWSGAFVDVWFSDDEQNVLRLANGYPGNSRHLSETQFGHCLKKYKSNKNLYFELQKENTAVEKKVPFLPFLLSFHFCFALLYWQAPRQFQQLLQAGKGTK